MSQNVRTPYTAGATSSDTGGGCAVFLIVIGIGIAILALAIGLVMAFVTIESSEIEAEALEPVVIDVVEIAPDPDPTAMPQPTATAEPTATPSPTETAEADIEVETLGDANDYDAEAAEIVNLVFGSLERYSELMVASSPDDPEWLSAFEAEMDAWKSAHDRVEQLQPGEQNLESYRSLHAATLGFRDASDHLLAGVIADDLNETVTGIDLITNALPVLIEASMQLEQERLR